MDIQVIKELMNEFKEAELTKLALKCEAFELTLEKEKEIISVGAQQIPSASAAYPSVTMNCGIDTMADKEVNIEKKHIVSPMVGTFYASNTPGGEPFIKIGSKVKKGDIVCIIEAMKLMNEVEAEIEGEIVEILASNEQMVEYAQPLFVIK
ncbi:MAG: acetyl-CoA carboxylase, biotin carboxyl carrier protein [Clostridia bacterium]|jgi:acetyl-CoA carboxylase biotin carboxyl carrier protein|nr:acetyl-CoA carboxylase, biotin carboxyl carrier protein [Clostridia bacterium]